MTRHPQTKPFQNSVFAGQETFLMEEELFRLKAKLGDGASMNWATYNAEEGINLDDILNLCNTLPFLSEKRLIVIRNAHKLSEKQTEQILSYLENPSETTTLILALEGEKLDDKLLKKLGSNSSIVRFDPIKNRAERLQWILDRAMMHGKTIEKDAAMLLAEMTGANMWFIATEIEKLCLYAAACTAITIKDVQEMVMRTYEPSIFAFLDALFDRKKDALFKLYEIEMAGIPELEIINRIENQIITHIQVLSGKDWKKSGIHSFVAEKAMARKSLWSTSQLLGLLKDVRAIEHRLKSSSATHIFVALTEVIGRVVLGTRNEERLSRRQPLR
jgi:DNA polymerase III subunit delta